MEHTNIKCGKKDLKHDLLTKVGDMKKAIDNGNSNVQIINDQVSVLRLLGDINI